MKISVSLSAFPAAEGAPVLFSEGTQKNISRIADLGYDGVDLFVKDPHSYETKKTVELLKRHGLGIGVIMPAALAGQGLTLGDARSEVRQTCVSEIGDIVRLAEEAGAMVSLGLVRGNRQRDESLGDFYSRFTSSVETLLKISVPAAVTLLIEPINRYEINTINSTREGVDYIRESGLPLSLMLDTFHMNIEDSSIEEALKEAMCLTKHIHFLDSNRLAPSMGHLDMVKYYDIIEKGGYNGYLCLEALPKPSACACAKAGANFFVHMRERKK